MVIERSGPAMTDLTNALGMLRDVARTRLCRIADHAHMPAEQLTCAGLPAQEQARRVDQELDRALVRTGRIGDQMDPHAPTSPGRGNPAYRDHSPSPSRYPRTCR